MCHTFFVSKRAQVILYGERNRSNVNANSNLLLCLQSRERALKSRIEKNKSKRAAFELLNNASPNHEVHSQSITEIKSPSSANKEQESGRAALVNCSIAAVIEEMVERRQPSKDAGNRKTRRTCKSFCYRENNSMPFVSPWHLFDCFAPPLGGCAGIATARRAKRRT